jgi:formate/nitrite transporter FocA (FNT family)
MGILIKDVAGVANTNANLSWAGFRQQFASVTIGNIIGGAIFVAVLYWYTYLKGKTD